MKLIGFIYTTDNNILPIINPTLYRFNYDNWTAELRHYVIHSASTNESTACLILLLMAIRLVYA